jgi:hypothetical protein
VHGGQAAILGSDVPQDPAHGIGVQRFHHVAPVQAEAVAGMRLTEPGQHLSPEPVHDREGQNEGKLALLISTRHDQRLFTARRCDVSAPGRDPDKRLKWRADRGDFEVAPLRCKVFGRSMQLEPITGNVASVIKRFRCEAAAGLRSRRILVFLEKCEDGAPGALRRRRGRARRIEQTHEIEHSPKHRHSCNDLRSTTVPSRSRLRSAQAVSYRLSGEIEGPMC